MNSKTQLDYKMSSRSTYNIKEIDKVKLEKLAIEASFKIGKPIKWTEIMNVLIQEYSKDAQSNIIHRERAKM